MRLLSLTRDVEVWKRREHSHVRAARKQIHWLNSASVGEMRHPWLSGDSVAKAAAWTKFAANGLPAETRQMQSNLAVSDQALDHGDHVTRANRIVHTRLDA